MDVPRKPDPKNAYLELHDGWYCVSMGVPAPVRSLVGANRLKQSFGTRSLLSANVLKGPVVRGFKARIDRAWETVSGRKGSELQEATAWARILAHSGRPGDADYAASLRDLGVDEQVEGRRRSPVNFHSFRKWFITEAERAAVAGDLVAAIVGHKRSGLTLWR